MFAEAGLLPPDEQPEEGEDTEVESVKSEPMQSITSDIKYQELMDLYHRDSSVTPWETYPTMMEHCFFLKGGVM